MTRCGSTRAQGQHNDRACRGRPIQQLLTRSICTAYCGVDHLSVQACIDSSLHLPQRPLCNPRVVVACAVHNHLCVVVKNGFVGTFDSFNDPALHQVAYTHSLLPIPHLHPHAHQVELVVRSESRVYTFGLAAAKPSAIKTATILPCKLVSARLGHAFAGNSHLFSRSSPGPVPWPNPGPATSRSPGVNLLSNVAL